MAKKNRFDEDERLEEEFNINHLKRTFVYIGRRKKSMIMALLFSAVSSVCSLIPAKIIGYAVDHTIPNKDVRQLLLLALAVVVIVALSVTLAVIRARIMTRVGQNIIFDIRTDLFNKLQELPFTFYDSRPHGKILVRVINYVNNVSDMLSNGMINFVLEIFNIIFILIFMFTTSVKMTLIIFAGVPVLIAGLAMLKPRQRRAWQIVNNKGSNMNAYLQESINGVAISQNFVRQDENETIFDDLNLNNYESVMHAIKLAYWTTNMVDLISIVAISVMYMAGVAWIRPAITFGVLLVMADYAWRMWQPIINIANLYNQLLNTLSYLERIFEIIDEPVLLTDSEDAKELPPITGNVDFDDVTFCYDDGDENVLEHIDLHVKAGESIALVGPTGAGKSTIVNLLSRFYDVTGGSVKIDGKDVRDVTIHSLRSQMGVMQQDGFIFTGSVSDNVRYGRLDATQEEIEEACRTVFADEFIREMEQGYDTQVEDKESTLSQGQKQLVAFARTLIRDPKILILDEATSSIDTKTERLVQEGLDRLMDGRTTFVVAHRLSTIKNCDKILYIANKGIAEMGTHSELMKKRGFYYEMVTAQM